MSSRVKAKYETYVEVWKYKEKKKGAEWKETKRYEDFSYKTFIKAEELEKGRHSYMIYDNLLQRNLNIQFNILWPNSYVIIHSHLHTHLFIHVLTRPQIIQIYTYEFIWKGLLQITTQIHLSSGSFSFFHYKMSWQLARLVYPSLFASHRTTRVIENRTISNQKPCRIHK